MKDYLNSLETDFDSEILLIASAKRGAILTIFILVFFVFS